MDTVQEPVARPRPAPRSESPEAPAWPKEPYKGLAYYGAEDRRLFYGRDDDVEACIGRLTSVDTGILLIHGHTGCGKSSFLRAGLIPDLEEFSTGYLFMRDDADKPVFIRCGADPLSRLAEQVWRFASLGVTVGGAKGRRHFDLSGALKGYDDLPAFVAAAARRGALLRALHGIASQLTSTLVVILDQAEEVITLDDGVQPHRRNFFRFLRELAATSLPVKLLIALRKDYSGQFVELAQVGGGVDIRHRASTRWQSRATSARPSHEPAPDEFAPALDDSPEAAWRPASAPPATLEVRSDLKLFLLPELDRDAVGRAIVLPTLGREDDPDSALAHFRFRYAQDVVATMLDDLFLMSSTAVLPVMQIACRDLYRQARTTAGLAVIDMRRYVEGGRISGPVDRHISESLKAGICKTLSHSDFRAEELRWRATLARLVKRESDGTVHTAVVTLDELIGYAQAERTTVDVASVVEHLTQPEVLLLRRVKAGGEGGGALFSLGHDFIARVLDRWQEQSRAAEAVHARAAAIRRKAILATALSVSVIALLAALAVNFVRAGKAAQTYRVLLTSARLDQRDAPTLSMLNAVYATTLADKVRPLTMGMSRDDEADRFLAHLLAGLPASAPAGATYVGSAGNDRAEHVTLPLPKSGGFLGVDGDHVTILTPGGHRSFDLESMLGTYPQAAWSKVQSLASERAPGVVVLVRTLLGTAWDAQPDPRAAQVVVLTLAGPASKAFYSKDFFDPAGLGTGPAIRSTQPTPFYAPAPPPAAYMALSGGRVILRTPAVADAPKPGMPQTSHMKMRIFAPVSEDGSWHFDLAASIDDAPLDAHSPDTPIFLDDAIVMPNAPAGTRPLSGFMASPINPREGPFTPLFPPGDPLLCAQGCDWRWLVGVVNDGNLLAFGAPDPTAQTPANQQPGTMEGSSGYDLDSFSRLLLVDVALRRKLVVPVHDIEAARAGCDTTAKPADRVALPRASNVRLFVARGGSTPVLGLVNKQAVDLFSLIVMPSGPVVVQCVGTFAFLDDAIPWNVTADGKAMLGIGKETQARWALGQSLDQRAQVLLKDNALRRQACDAGLRRQIASMKATDWVAATRLQGEPLQLCDGT